MHRAYCFAYDCTALRVDLLQLQAQGATGQAALPLATDHSITDATTDSHVAQDHGMFPPSVPELHRSQVVFQSIQRQCLLSWLRDAALLHCLQDNEPSASMVIWQSGLGACVQGSAAWCVHYKEQSLFL